MGRRAVRAARRHWVFLLVLSLAFGVRLAASLAYPPALFYDDSVVYLNSAYSAFPFDFTYSRPGGYSFLIRLLAPWEPHFLRITIAQHLAGLAVGALVYAMLVRLRIPRWLAALASAVVLLDAYAIALEQHILAESFFTLMLFGSAYLAITRPRSAPALVASGLLLGAATMIRAPSLFAVPIWLLYVVWSHTRWRVVFAAAASVILPLLAYAAIYADQTGTFGLTQATGRFLYGRIAPIYDCRGAAVPPPARPLCHLTPEDRRWRRKFGGPEYFVWHWRAPPNRVFDRDRSAAGDRRESRVDGPSAEDHRVHGRVDSTLNDFAMAMIRHRPLGYARVVGRDFLRYFSPGVPSPPTTDQPILFPASSARAIQVGNKPKTLERSPKGRREKQKPVRQYLGGNARVNQPAGAVRAYAAVIHTPRWLLGVLSALAVVVTATAVRRRGEPLPHRREVFLLTGSALAMLVGSVATLYFTIRYLVPLVPLIVAGGILAVNDIVLALSARRKRPISGDPAST